ncbi:MAG: ribosome recycling factor [Hyphomicrobiales bacterium]|nr:ribosome recycling factor [Hyphomicrobiales bacterium]
MDLNDLERRMKGAVSVLKSEFAGLRTGRASISLLEPLTVDVYGASMPINQVATISVPEARMLSVQVWDRSNVQAVDRAIRESRLGLNPIVEGELLRIPIPELNAERRQELVKVAHKYAEQAKIAVRHVRRDGLDSLKKEEKEGGLGEDESHGIADRIQALTDANVSEIDDMLSQKEAEITQV